MPIAYISDYLERAKLRMLSQFKDDISPNINKLLTIFISEVQEAEDVVDQLITLRGMATAEGEQLDVLGSIVGINREGRTDNEYRNAIYVQIAVNNGGGQESVLTRLTRLITGAAIVDIWELFPAGLDIFINTPAPSNLESYLRRAIAATVSFQISSTTGGPPFAFEGDSYGEGFGTTEDPDIGGEFPSITFAG